MSDVKACLVCGEELVYFEQSREMECVYCHKKFMSNTACKNGHFVCDECHAGQAIRDIKKICLHSTSTNPIEIAVSMMKDEFVHMHGPENHVLVGAALLAAYKNAGGNIDLNAAIDEMTERGGEVPGGICGFWGSCGAAVSTGIFTSIITGSTPLSQESYGLCNKMTSECLASISEIGGPRCCKRNAFLSIEQAVKFCREHFNISMTLPEQKYICSFTAQNQQCIGKRCPYNPVNARTRFTADKNK